MMFWICINNKSLLLNCAVIDVVLIQFSSNFNHGYWSCAGNFDVVILQCHNSKPDFHWVWAFIHMCLCQGCFLDLFFFYYLLGNWCHKIIWTPNSAKLFSVLYIFSDNLCNTMDFCQISCEYITKRSNRCK